jgi:hypothetical protein
VTTAVWFVILGLALIASKGRKVWALCLLSLVLGLYFGHSPLHSWALTVMHWFGNVGAWVRANTTG